MKFTPFIALLALGLVSRLTAIDAPPTEVVMVDHAKMADAFAKNLPLLLNSSYKISAGRRVMTGTVEIHGRDTDILIVAEGTATFVTGGTVVEPKETGADEIRGTAIKGGVPHHLSKGDMIVIPPNTPHWFSEVNGTFLYYVIKITK